MNTEKVKKGTFAVLKAIGLPHEMMHGSLRITLGHATSEEDIDYVVESLKSIAIRLRSFSPLAKPMQV